MRFCSIFSLKKWVELYIHSERAKKLPDREYLKLRYYAVMGRKLRLDNPCTFNEKLQWLKLYNRRPEYTMMVDKYAVRKYIADKLGEEYLIPLLGVWDDPSEINFDELPEQFVLKCNHNSGLGMRICKDKSVLDIESVKKELSKGLKQDYYLIGREWPYKNVPKKIIAEKYISDSKGFDTLTDYKFYCFNGVVESVMLCLDRYTGDTKFYFFDEDWNLRRYNLRGKAALDGFTLPKPKGIDRMFEIARILSKGIPYVRVDLYNIDGDIFFSELTFFPQSGFDPNYLLETDKYFGQLIKLEDME